MIDANEPCWTLDSSMELIRTLACELAPRHHVGLTGGVLLRGWSEKDLDLIVYPASSIDRSEESRVAIRNALRAVGLTLLVDAQTMHRHWRSKGSTDEKHVEVWDFHGKRVDVFFM